MSKAILIMNMPECCGECEYHDIRLDSTIRCIVCKAHMGEGAPKSGRADQCPLQEMPEKKVLTPYKGHGVVSISELQQNSYERGYNACIDEILGN